MKKILSLVLAFFMAMSVLGTSVFSASAAEGDPAKIGDTTYESLAAAIDAAKSGDTIYLLKDISIEDTHNEGKSAIGVPAGVVIDGQGHTVTFDGVYHGSAAASFYAKGGAAYTVKNLTVKLTATGDNGFAFDMRYGGVLENVTVDQNYVSGIYAGSNTTVKGCTFNTATSGSYYGISTEGNPDNVLIENCTFNGNRAAILYGTNVKFIGNTVNSAKGVSVAAASGEISGNTFTGARALSISKLGTTIKDNALSETTKVEATVAADLSSNYWGTENGPAASQIVNETAGVEVIVDSYYKTNTEGTLGDLASTFVVKINGNEYKSLKEALNFVGAGAHVIELIEDATLDYGAREAYGIEETTSITINGNGHTLTLNQTNSDWSSIGLKNPEATLILNDMTIEKTGHGDTSGAWNKHAINFHCNVEMNDVTVNNSMAVSNGATLTNVIINEANGYYGLWISANDQAVTVNGGEINATNGGRGIKIADQYIDAPAKVKLEVTGTVFNTAKKAAVLVSSSAGADITASNVDISKVVEDPIYFVWIDEDWSKYDSEVTVSGASMTIEGVVPSYNVSISAEGNGTVSVDKDAYEAGETVALTIECSDGYMLYSLEAVDAQGKPVTIENDEFVMPTSAVTVTAVFTKIIPTYKVNVEVEGNGNVTFEKAAYAAGEIVTINIQHPDGYTLYSLEVVDAMGKAVAVKNCQFVMPEGGVTVTVEIVEELPVPAKVYFEANVALEGADLEAGLFQVELSYLYKNGTIKVQTLKNDADGKLKFAPVAFYAPCEHTFFIKQVACDAEGVEYDATVYEIKVKVTYDKEGTLVATVAQTAVDFVNTAK